jgi:hypothetical protein
LRSKFYFRLSEFLRTGKEELRSGNQEEEHIDDPGEVDHCDTKNVAADDTLWKLNVKIVVWREEPR